MSPSSCSRLIARTNEPALGRKTPLLICSMRYPVSMHRFQCERLQNKHVQSPLNDVAGPVRIKSSLPTGIQVEDTLLLLVVKRRNNPRRGGLKETLGASLCL